ncbi:MAG TPA: PhoPQ-activated pathogenicity-related family protein [Thermoanaerobaculia bacterium]|nr:PhoPQ-activated pathogenicity-related family protein [Thermoanaerobaculia bacterium]
MTSSHRLFATARRLPRSFGIVPLAIVLLALAGCRAGADHAAAEAADPVSGTDVAATPLDEYVATPDPAYRWEPVSRVENDGFETHVLHMTSQRWLSEAEVDRPLWEHWLTVVVPAEVSSDVAMLYIGGGDNEDDPPERPNPALAEAAVRARAITAELRMVPNQPITFTGDDYGPRVEDELIAYGWRRFLEGGAKDPIWLARLPMTKAAVRALDTVTAFAATEAGGNAQVGRFVVAGGSKRGWTTWTTAAVDDRVVAIVPIVIDLLNVVPSFEHHYRAYGFYAPAVGDYEREGIMEWQDTPEYRRLVEITEPFSYRHRLDLPKLIMNATGDQFFLPDSSQFYFDQLMGEKHLRYVPNSEHSMRDTDAQESLIAFFHAIVEDFPRPEVNWTRDRERMVVTASATPTAVLLWQAENPETRDFRVDTIGRSWSSSPLVAGEDGSWTAEVATPASGWRAFFVELTFDAPGELPLKLTTGIEVVPDSLPFEAPEPARAVAGG